MSQYPTPPRQFIPAPNMEAPGATAGLIFGILSIVFSAPIIGIILGYIGYSKSKSAMAYCDANPQYTNRGIAQAGYICGIVGMIISAVSTLCICGYLGIAVAILGGAAGR